MMTLKSIKPTKWHWTQAIAWKAFHGAELDPGDFVSWGVPLDDRTAIGNVTHAISELLRELAAGKLQPFRSHVDGLGPIHPLDDLFKPPLFDETRCDMFTQITGKASKEWRCQISHLHVDKTDVVERWPAPEKATSEVTVKAQARRPGEHKKATIDGWKSDFDAIEHARQVLGPGTPLRRAAEWASQDSPKSADALLRGHRRYRKHLDATRGKRAKTK